MIVAIYTGTGVVPVEEFRSADTVEDAVASFQGEHSPALTGYAGIDTGWTAVQPATDEHGWAVDVAGAAMVTSLESIKMTRYAEVDAVTVERIQQGFEFPPGSGQIFSLSERAQRTLTGAFAMRDMPEVTWPIVWNLRDDNATFSIPDPETMRLFFLQSAGTVVAWKNSGTQIKDAIRAATTETEVAAIIDPR